MRISDWSSDVCSSDLLDADTAHAIVERQFVEVIIAPSISAEAQAVIAAKKNVRVLECGDLPAIDARAPQLDYKRVTGGLLVQDQDIGMIHDRKSTRMNFRHSCATRMPSST